MDNGNTTNPNGGGADDALHAVEAAILELAYAAWGANREPEQDTSNALFDRAYLGQYSSIDGYVSELIDGYQLDAKLDAAIAQPFRRHVDIDVTALGQDLVTTGTLYALPAVPVGVWVFNGEIG